MHILQAGNEPVLGRLRGFSRKHRLRTKHYDTIDDFPENAQIDVIDAARLESVDFFTNQDEMWIVSAALKSVIESVVDGVVSHPVDAGGCPAFVIEPVSEDDVMYASDGDTPYSASGYNLLRAKKLRIAREDLDTETVPHFTNVRNTGLYAVSDELREAAESAGIRWALCESVETFEPYRKHPYAHVGVGYASVSVDEVEAEGYEEEYIKGATLPDLVALVDDIAKSRRNKRWKEYSASHVASLGGGLIAVSNEVKQIIAENTEMAFSKCVVREPTLEKELPFWVLYPPVVDWIDWDRSDVGMNWDGSVECYFDLHPTDASYEAVQPLARVAGSSLILAHEGISQLFQPHRGFHLTPLHHRFVARNLDDSIGVR